MPQMGKASKWIRNFLIGKKEEREKKKESSFSAESLATPIALLPPPTPKEKARWSFGRSASTDTTTYRSTRSFDSVVTAQLVTQALLEHENAQRCAMAIAVASNKGKHAVSAKPGPVEDEAATRIQAAFRSYLARKALCALRGLVKLQALARGHLVRKQTTAMMRCMHSLMAIQVRARVQRIQMATEEAQFNMRTRTTNRELVQGSQLSRTYSETMTMNINETRGSLKSKSGPLNYPKFERTETRFSRHLPKHDHQLQISPSPSALADKSSRICSNQFPKHDHQLQISPSPSALADKSSRICSNQFPNHDHQLQISPSPSALADKSSRICSNQFQEHSFTKSQRSPQHFSTMFDTNQTRAPFSTPVPDYTDSMPHDYQFSPNYMANTQSSKAKARSRSEPKQRPKCRTKQKNRRTASMEGMDKETLMQNSMSHAKPTAKKNQYPWLMRIYRQTKSIKDSECDSTSTLTNNSNYNNSLIVYEPPVNLY